MPTQPSFGKGRESNPKNIVLNPDQATYMSATLESGIGPIEPGDVLGKRTATKRFAQVVKAVLQGEASGANATVSVDSVSLLSAGDTALLSRGETEEETQAIASVDADNDTVTFSGTLDNTHPTGRTIRLSDGSEKAVAIYPGDRKISKERLDKGSLNDGIVVGNALVDSGTLNHSDSNAISDLNDDFIFKP